MSNTTAPNIQASTLSQEEIKNLIDKNYSDFTFPDIQTLLIAGTCALAITAHSPTTNLMRSGFGASSIEIRDSRIIDRRINQRKELLDDINALNPENSITSLDELIDGDQIKMEMQIMSDYMQEMRPFIKKQKKKVVLYKK